MRLLVSPATVNPWQILSQSTLEGPGQGALVLPCPIASSPHSSHILRQGAPGSYRTQEWEPLPSNHRLPLGPFAASARAGPPFSHLLLFLLSGQVPFNPCSSPLLTILSRCALPHLPAPTLGTAHLPGEPGLR